MDLIAEFLVEVNEAHDECNLDEVLEARCACL